MVPIYGKLVTGAKFEREKTALRDSQRSNFDDSLWDLAFVLFANVKLRLTHIPFRKSGTFQKKLR